MNYDLEMQKQMGNIKEGTKLLLHACCAPCSSAVLERLSDFFEITIFYYNPNITEEKEYLKRIEELKKFISLVKYKYPISLILGNYEPQKFFEMAKGLEDEPERGKRCYKCYAMRLEESARIADELGFDYFCTTLTLSPHKNSNWINEIGEDLNNRYNSIYLYSDFKKRNGYKRSIELSKEYDLYRQDYCGCVYSLRDKMKE
ncbi:MAG: epoxyqueuosine reductase QueH [Bacilli bacterium]|nr:epoxyqueuosine reductase QueH [Bacilli bacterium]